MALDLVVATTPLQRLNLLWVRGCNCENPVAQKVEVQRSQQIAKHRSSPRFLGGLAKESLNCILTRSNPNRRRVD